jgi:hypothetical protein
VVLVLSPLWGVLQGRDEQQGCIQGHLPHCAVWCYVALGITLSSTCYVYNIVQPIDTESAFLLLAGTRLASHFDEQELHRCAASALCNIGMRMTCSRAQQLPGSCVLQLTTH